MNTNGKLDFIGFVEEANEEDAKLTILPEFCAGLKGIEEFSHLIVLYWAHLRTSKEERRTLLVVPKRHTIDFEVGVFASRSPTRPNPICLCTVELVKVEGCFIMVRGLDASKGSPIIDIKPYIPRADSIPDARVPYWMHHGPKT